MNIIYRESEAIDLKSYTSLMQQTYTDAYVDESIGLTPECFSNAVFQTEDTQKYLKNKLSNNASHKTWVACIDDTIVGAVTIADEGASYEMSGFYVLPAYQRNGIGKKLWSLVQDFAKNKDITLDIYTHNTKTIELYKRWGFKEDRARARFYRHWNEWPDGLMAESMYMRRVSK